MNKRRKQWRQGRIQDLSEGGGARFNLEQTDLGIKRCAADEIFFDFPVLHKVFPLKFY